MALLKGKLIIEVKYEDLPGPLLGYTLAFIYRTCAEQLYYRRPWASEEGFKKKDPKCRVSLSFMSI
jgi:hypothetical protein